MKPWQAASWDESHLEPMGLLYPEPYAVRDVHEGS